MQNNALRVIHKKGLLDKIPSDVLREKSQVDTVETRHKHLLESYYEKAIVSRRLSPQLYLIGHRLPKTFVIHQIFFFLVPYPGSS